VPRSSMSRSRLAGGRVLLLSSFGALMFADASVAADASAYVALTTDYVFRGVTYSDGHPAAQVGGDVAFESGIYLGAWVSTVDIESGQTINRDLEADFYVGYSYPWSDTVTLGANVVAYTFPNAKGPVDYDYIEYSVSINYDDQLWAEYAYAPDLYSIDANGHNYAIFAELPLAAEFALGAGIGFYDLSDLSGSDYTYWELGVGRSFGQLGVDLRYHDASDWVPRWSNSDRVGARIVLSAEFRF